MPDDRLRTIVRKAVEEGQSEDTIASIIKRYNQVNTPQQPDTYKGPTDFWGGVKQSLGSGEAFDTGMRGGLGYLKGAIADIPSSIGSGLSSLGNLIADPKGTVESIPQGLSNAWEGIKNTTSQAGSNPEAFGEMMGQITGQPAVTHGLIKTAPITLPIAGKGLAAVGNALNDYRPFSRFAPSWIGRPGWNMLEGGIGRGTAAIGEQLQRAKGIPEAPIPETPPSNMKMFPPTRGGPIYSPPPEVIDAQPANTGDFGPLPPEPLKQLPPASSIQMPGNTTTFEPQSPIVGQPPAPPIQGQDIFNQSVQKALPPSPVSQYLPGNTTTFEPQSPIIGNQPSPAMPHGIPELPPEAPPTPPPVPNTPTASGIATVPGSKLNPSMFPQLIKYAKGKGYEFLGLDSSGNLQFRIK